MAEKKIPKINTPSDQLSDSDTPDEEVDPWLCTSEEEKQHGMIKGSAQATQAALSHSRVQTNPTIERGPPQRPKTKKLPRDKAAEKGTRLRIRKNKCNEHLLCIVIICTYIFYCAFVTLYLYIRTLRTMNASTWKKAADIVAKTTSVTLQASATATVESHNLQSLQLSTLSIDDNGPPQVTYEPQQPIATGTPRATDNSETPTEAYRQTLPGMTSRLYPTLVADSSLEPHVSDQQDTLQMQLSTEVDKYLQEAAAK